MPVSPGTQLGPYLLLAPIGAGGMGEVWKARDTRLDRVVAIKRIKGEHTARLEQEARAIAALNHPHICQIHDVGPDYLVMEFIDGAPLRGPLPAGEALRLAIQIAGALEAAHARGILHRGSEARQYPGGRRDCQAAGFRLGEIHRGRGRHPDDGGDRGWHASVHGTGAGGGQAGRRALGMSSVLARYFTRCWRGSVRLTALPPWCATAPSRWKCRRKWRASSCSACERCPPNDSTAWRNCEAALEQAAARPAEQQPSIAVLPFANVSLDPDDEYFSDGLAEEIMNTLAHLPG